MLPDVFAAAILLSLVVYALLGGADFGGGVWDLLARGPRAAAQREVIAGAIGPVWEANHIWMILAVVLLFTAFPPAFAVIMTALHVPLTVMLVGIVLRGSSFVFRKVDPGGEGATSGWQRVFATSSLLTPVMLGVVVGTISTDAIGWRDGVATGGFLLPWLRPFPWAVGFLTVALFAFLAATYLTLETDDPELVADFRRRALAASGAVALLGAVVALLAPGAAPEVAEHLTGTTVGRGMLMAGAGSLGGTVLALRAGWYRTARALAAATAVAILVGWGWGMHPWLVVGAVTVEGAASPDATLRLVGIALLAGGALLVPAYWYLYRVFKGGVLVGRPTSLE